MRILLAGYRFLEPLGAAVRRHADEDQHQRRDHVTYPDVLDHEPSLLAVNRARSVPAANIV